MLCTMMHPGKYRCTESDVQHRTPSHRHVVSHAGLHRDSNGNKTEMEKATTVRYLREKTTP